MQTISLAVRFLQTMLLLREQNSLLSKLTVLVVKRVGVATRGLTK